MIFNYIEPSKEPISFVQGDDVDFTMHIQTRNDAGVLEDYPLDGLDLRMVIVNKHGTIIADWSTDGGELTAVGAYLSVLADAIDAVSCCGSFDGQLAEVDPQHTIWSGIVKISKGLI